MFTPHSYVKDFSSGVEDHHQNHRLSFFFKIELAMLAFVLVGFFFFEKATSATFHSALQAEIKPTLENSQPVVLGEATENVAAISPTVTVTPLPPSPTPLPLIVLKKTYTVAVIGDSMVDTMGEVCEYLEHALKKKYPQNDFKLYNFGRGAENVEQGLARFNSAFDYKDRHYPSIPQIKPDVIIVASFAYNPFSPHDRDRHWLTLTKMVEEAKKNSPQVYLLAEIAPLRGDFGKGPNGVNYDTDAAYTHSGRIIEQLENTVGLAKTLDIPLINAYHPSLVRDGEGDRKLVNPSDGIHPSVAGHEFIAKIIVDSLKLE